MSKEESQDGKRRESWEGGKITRVRVDEGSVSQLARSPKKLVILKAEESCCSLLPSFHLEKRDKERKSRGWKDLRRKMKIEGERKRKKKPQGTFRVTQTCRQLLVGFSPGLSLH